jgi:hypothetical protein
MKKKLDPIIEGLPLKPKTRSEVADEYGISVNTLKSKINRAKITVPPGLLFPSTLKLIYYALGLPARLKSA